MAKRLQDLINQDPNGYISMAELDALEAAQLGQPIGQIPGSFGPGQGSFQRSGGNLVNLTPQGWQDTQTQEMMAPASSRPNQDVQLDYASPLDYMGAKGYRLKGDPNRVLLSDGRMVTLDAGDVAAKQAIRQKQEAAQLDMELKRQQLESARGGEWQLADKSGVMINKRTGEIKKLPAGAGGGDIEWKYDAASDEFVAPPTAEFPMGRRSGNISKTNAAKGMDYVVNQFKGTPDQPGALETATQGGPLGVKGLLGKVFDSQDSKRFDNLKEQMSTELRTLFRIPGEGTLSDKEQAQYGIQLPQVTNSKENNEAIIKDIQARIAARLDTGANPLMSQGNKSPPRAGMVQDGYVFMGGNPADQKSWKKAQ